MSPERPRARLPSGRGRPLLVALSLAASASAACSSIPEGGAPSSELASLTRKEIDWQSNPPRIVVHGKGGPFGTRSKRRVVPLASRRSRALLEGHFALHETLGATTRTLHRIVRRVAQRAGITRKTSPHVLRHTFSVDSIRKGVSLPALQKVLGHDHLTTTQIYLNMSPEDILREYEEKW